MCFRFDHLQGAADCKIKKKTWDQNTGLSLGMLEKRQYIQTSIVLSVLFNPELNVYSLNHSKVQIFIDTAVKHAEKKNEISLDTTSENLIPIQIM